MNTEIINEFKRLKLCGQRFTVNKSEKEKADRDLILYLQSLLESNQITDFEDIGFCYWNISDSFAMLGDGNALLLNHKKFYDFVKQEDHKYLHWLVCDATQRLTLEHTGSYDFWWDIYKTATSFETRPENFFVEFTSFRAALYFSSLVSSDDIKYSVERFSQFLEKTKNCDEYSFYRICYLSLISRYIRFDICELISLCENQLGMLTASDEEKPLPGMWSSLVTPFSKRKQAEISLNSAINALIYANKNKEAKELYYKTLAVSNKRNAYIESQLK